MKKKPYTLVGKMKDGPILATTNVPMNQSGLAVLRFLSDMYGVEDIRHPFCAVCDTLVKKGEPHIQCTKKP